MKNLLLLFISAFIYVSAFGQGVETFANSNATANYADNSFVGNGGITWTYVQSRDANSDANSSGISLPALMLRRVADNSAISSGTISGGIGNFSVKLYNGFTGAGNRQVELFINDVSKGTSTEFDDFDEHVFTVNNIDVSGDIVIKIVNVTEKQIIIDDITWTSAGGTSNQTEIVSFEVPNQQGETIINSSAHTVDFDMLSGNDITALDPTITISNGASIVPASGVTQNFTNAVTYTVTAEDEATTQEWTVTAHFVEEIVTIFEEDFESVSDDVDLVLNEWVNYNEAGSRVWRGKVYNSNGSAGVTSYGSGEENIIWLITPDILFVNTTSETLAFDVKIGYWKHAGLSIYISDDFDGTDVGSATWTDVTSNFTIPEEPTGSYGTFVAAGTMDISAYSNTINVAFKYLGDGNNDQTTSYMVDNVKVEGYALSSETDILTFVLSEQFGNATIDNTEHTVDIVVVNGTNVTALEPTITVSNGATVNPASGVATDFSNAVVYTVTAGDNTTTQEWTVTVTIGGDLSSEAEILTFTLDDEVQDAVINSDDATVSAVVKWDTDISFLSPTITVSAGAQVSQTVDVDFTNPVTIKVQAQDKVTIKDWIITVTNAAEPNHDAEILIFMLDELASDVTINTATATITGQLYAGVDTSSLSPTITVSSGAIIDPESGIAQDFTSDVVYTVTAEDGTTTKDWTVSLTVNDVELIPIFDIQYTTDESGDSDYFGRLLKTQGVITGFDGYGFYMQDSTKAWNGIYIFASDFIAGLNVGDDVIVEGTVNEYFGLTQLKDLTAVNVVSSDNPVPDALLVAVTEIAEPYESVIIRANELTCVSTELYHGAWRVVNGSDSLYIGNELHPYSPELGDVFISISGINTYKRSYFRILPRSADDIDKVVGVKDNQLADINIFPNPVSNNLTVNNLGNASQIVISNVLGQTIITVAVTSSTVNINTNNLDNGIYLITIVDNNNNIRTERVIKK